MLQLTIEEVTLTSVFFFIFLQSMPRPDWGWLKENVVEGINHKIEMILNRKVVACQKGFYKWTHTKITETVAIF